MRRRAWRSARLGVAQSLVGAALAVLATASAASASRPGPKAGTGQLAQDSVARGTPQRMVQRPFRHQPHDALPCRGCHGAGATHRTTRVRTPTDCAACHHDPARRLSCATCHGTGSIPAERTVRMTLALQVTNTPRERDITFRHDVHVATGSGLTCQDCHATAVTMARNRECGSCHASHHSDRVDCSRCHAPPKRDVHDASVHLTCAGSTCHAPAKAPVPTLSRTTCLFCHADKKEHEPEGSCALCHRIPGAKGLTRVPDAMRGGMGP